MKRTMLWKMLAMMLVVVMVFSIAALAEQLISETYHLPEVQKEEVKAEPKAEVKEEAKEEAKEETKEEAEKAESEAAPAAQSEAEASEEDAPAQEEASDNTETTPAEEGTEPAEGETAEETEQEPASEEEQPEQAPAAKVSVKMETNIEPEDLKVGDHFKMKAVITGLEKGTYTIQWQCDFAETGSDRWQDIKGATSDEYEVVITEDMAGYSWRFIVDDGK